MKVLIKLSLLLFFLSICSLAMAQEDINTEAFTFNFSPNDKGADIVYLGKSHSFGLNIVSPAVSREQVQGTDNNQSFIKIGKDVIQFSLVNLPQPIPASMQLSKLTDDETKETLEGYVNYELDYFNKGLNLTTNSVKKEWKTINARLYLVWYFEFKAPGTDADKKFAAQIYYSTICFNQVLDINTPLYSKDDFERSKTLIETIAGTLTNYDKRLDVKK